MADSHVAEIRVLYAEGHLTQLEIAEMFGIQHQQVSRIVRGERRVQQDGPISNHDHRLTHSRRNERDSLTGHFLPRNQS